MLTFKDCIDVTDLTPDEVDAIIAHEHLPALAALAKGASFLEHPWGEPALRQIALDNLVRCRTAERQRRLPKAEAVYLDVCVHHPGGVDRREPYRR